MVIQEKLALIIDFDQVLGLGLSDVKPRASIKIPAKIKKLAAEREQARMNKNFVHADELREEIEEAGFRVEDTSKGPVFSNLCFQF